MSYDIVKTVGEFFACRAQPCPDKQHCPANHTGLAMALARAVAERVKAEARVCDCDEEQLGPDPDCPRCSGRGVTFGGG